MASRTVSQQLFLKTTILNYPYMQHSTDEKLLRKWEETTMTTNILQGQLKYLTFSSYFPLFSRSPIFEKI